MFERVARTRIKRFWFSRWFGIAGKGIPLRSRAVILKYTQKSREQHDLLSGYNYPKSLDYEINNKRF